MGGVSLLRIKSSRGGREGERVVFPLGGSRVGESLRKYGGPGREGGGCVPVGVEDGRVEKRERWGEPLSFKKKLGLVGGKRGGGKGAGIT